MIRLAITGIEEFTTQQVAVRLRQTTFVESSGVGRRVPPENCDAIAFLGCESVENHLIAKCLSKRIHVMLASPKSDSGHELGELYVAAAKSNAQFAVFNPDRYLPSRQLIHDQLAVGQLGEVGLIRSHRWESRENTGDNDRSVPHSLVCDLELTSWLFGETPEVVYAVEHASARHATHKQHENSRHQQAGRSIQVHMGFDGGGMALVDYSNRLPSGSGYQMLSVIGSAGVACADDHRNVQLHFSGGHPRGLSSSERTRGLTSMLQAFVDNLIAGKDMSSSVKEWQRTLQLAASVTQSLNSRSAVSLKEQ